MKICKMKGYILWFFKLSELEQVDLEFLAHQRLYENWIISHFIVEDISTYKSLIQVWVVKLKGGTFFYVEYM